MLEELPARLQDKHREKNSWASCFGERELGTSLTLSRHVFSSNGSLQAPTDLRILALYVQDFRIPNGRTLEKRLENVCIWGLGLGDAVCP